MHRIIAINLTLRNITIFNTKNVINATLLIVGLCRRTYQDDDDIGQYEKKKTLYLFEIQTI